jgi:hypothetical protein
MFRRFLIGAVSLGFLSFTCELAWAQDNADEVSIEAFVAKGKFVRHANALAYVEPIVTTLASKDARFKKIKGLADPKGVSFESHNFPEMYLRHRNGRLMVTSCPDEGDKSDATFFIKQGFASDQDGWVSLELLTHPGCFVRTKEGELWAEAKKEDATFRESATFRLIAPVSPAPKGPKGTKLLIVAPRRFHAALARFVSHKAQLLPTELVTLETIRQETPGTDDAEKLKLYIYRRWKADKVGYVLLVGDGEIMPIRYTSIHGDRPGYGGWLFIPSDLYYGNLAKEDGSFDDWNSAKDGYPAGYYGKIQGDKGENPINIDKIGYVPDVAVGRWPVHTEAQVRVLVAKTINYENHVLRDDVPVIRRSAFINGANLVDARTSMNEWAKKLESISKMKPVRLLFKDKDRDDGTPPPNEQEVQNALKGGVGMLFHIGHGNETSWDGCLDLVHTVFLKETKLPPVMFSVGCVTAAFAPICPEMPYLDIDGKAHPGVESKKERFTNPPPPPNPYQPKLFDRSSLGVELLRNGEKGAVAYIGCNCGAQSFAAPMMDGFLEYVALTPKPRLGDAWVAGLTEYYYDMRLGSLKAHDWVQLTTFHQGTKFQLFGDPSLRLPRSPKSK